MDKHGNSKPLVLVLEDEAIIALNLQDELQDAGYKVAGPFSTCHAARQWLEANTPDLAILDATLRDGPCREIAIELSRREVPFLIYSGHQDDNPDMAEFQDNIWIEKPAAPSVLVQACRGLMVGCD
jgi:DNA-binding response OmpR family regulator